MPHDPDPHIFSCFGFVIWGDFADLTMYVNRNGRLIWFKKTWPDQPASPKQLAQRQLWKNAAQAWHALTSQQQENWERATKKLSLFMNGYSLFLAFQLNPDPAALATISRQSGIPLP